MTSNELMSEAVQAMENAFFEALDTSYEAAQDDPLTKAFEEIVVASTAQTEGDLGARTKIIVTLQNWQKVLLATEEKLKYGSQATLPY